MNKCEYFPEITNCAKCEYFDLKQNDNGFSDYEPVCRKREEEKTKRIEEKKQTFAEWLLNYVSTHRDTVMRIEQGPWGGIKLQIRDYSKSRFGVAVYSVITNQLYQASELNFDEILINVAEELCKEIGNYGK